MKTVNVNLDERSYAINIGHTLSIGELTGVESGLKVLIVTDSNVGPLYGDWCVKQLSAMGINSVITEIPAGETSKSLEMVESLYNAAFNANLDRSSVILALGGGVVGDIAGFVAATFMRGIRFVQVPTTLLAMVDSSVGGKTAVNVKQGKNLIGAFYQPSSVSADLATLRTLPDREYISGLAEVVKYGVIRDAALFEQLEMNVEKLKARDTVLLEDVVARCCEIKAEIVALDERESGLRSILNFGHTLGHAIEKVSGYGKYLHGEALSAGMEFAMRLSVKEKNLPDVAFDRLSMLLNELGLPRCSDIITDNMSWDDIRKAMNLDKKTTNNIPRFVLIEQIGNSIYGCNVSEDVLSSSHCW